MSTNGKTKQSLNGKGATETSGHKAADEFVKRISASWEKAVASIIETGRLLIEAKQELPHGAFQRMIDNRLPFGRRTAQMLMKIAEHPVLGKAKNFSHLPPSWSALHQLSYLPADEVEWLIKKKLLTSQTRYSDVKKLGFYEWGRVGDALNVLIEYMLHWSPDKLAKYAPFPSRDTDLSHTGKLPDYITRLRQSWLKNKKSGSVGKRDEQRLSEEDDKRGDWLIAYDKKEAALAQGRVDG
jgi:Protein of unknown function (DUF3102)